MPSPEILRMTRSTEVHGWQPISFCQTLFAFPPSYTLANAVSNVCEAPRSGAPLDPPESLAQAVGLESWVGEFRSARPGPEIVQERIDLWFAEFEAEEDRLGLSNTARLVIQRKLNPRFTRQMSARRGE